jgi:PAS domain S-box-containing protein
MAPSDGMAPLATSAGKQDTAEGCGPTPGIPVIGLGGSAGALECFKTFFQAMPPDSGAAFVVIQHLAPAHVSMLSELLAQHTRMKVAEAQDGVPVEANCVYVIPPNEYLGLREGILYLAEPIKRDGIRMPIDFFLRSLAEDRQEQSICVLFSGAGSDGTLGVRAVRGAGGLTIAQDPQTAQYGDMPRSAIATKLVDFILSPDQVPQAIMDYLRQPYVRGGQPPAVLESQGKLGRFDEILAAVHAQTGCDFRCYKKTTILRRIERRMGLHRIADMDEYVKLLRRNADEVCQLQKDLLINVTAFFRDADAFEELRLKAIGPAIQAKAPDETLRVWVPACSSGEEAYSIAMLLMEEMMAARKTCPLQVFATDIDEEALEFGRQGIYPESIAADVGLDRLARFFVRKEQGFQVSESLRACVLFAQQNLITDPPFSKMDIISCRNLLIYLDADTQTRLVPVFNFALNGGGYLFLGKSEGVGTQGDLFDVVSKKARLYRRVTPARPIILDTPILPGRRKLAMVGQPPAKPPATLYSEAIRQAILSHFGAGVVLVDRKGQILQFHGQTGKYLNMPTGEPNLNLLDIAKEGLAMRLRSALHAAINDGKPVVLEPLALRPEEGGAFVRVTIAPLPRRGESELLLAVIFEDVPRPEFPNAQPAQAGGSDTAVRQLEEELRALQQDLQSSIEELQSANEELRVSNEEVVSTNEELQSTNEELETSKEELQSVNEELTTVNSQLQEKAERLAAANSDLSNLLKSTQIATLFLDAEMRVKFFTPATERVMKLIRSDIGRPISDLSTNFIDYDLTADALAVAMGCVADVPSACAEGILPSCAAGVPPASETSLHPQRGQQQQRQDAGRMPSAHAGETPASQIERDVRHSDGSVYHVRVMPYLAQEDRREGVVVTFDDVSRLRRAEERTRRLATVVTDSNDAVILFDPRGSIQAWNRGATAMYGWSEEEALRMNIRDLATPEEMANLGDLIRRVIGGETIGSAETRRRGKDERVLDVWLTITAVLDETGQLAAIATTERDITERKRAETSLREEERFRRAVLDALPAKVAVLNPGGLVMAVNERWAELEVGCNYLDICRKAAASGDASSAEALAVIESVLQGKMSEGHFEYPCFTGQKPQWFLMQAVHASEKVGGAIISHMDVTARKAAEEMAAHLAAIVESSNEAIVSKDLAGVIFTWNAGAERMFGFRAEEAIGQPIAIMLPSDRLEEEDNVLQRQRKGEWVENFETVRQTKDGRRIDVVVSSSPLRDHQGRVIGASKIIHDISDRKHAEARLKETADELERSNQDLMQFAQIASHDLQEPLRMVSGFLKILDERYKPQLDDKAREYIGFAVEGATRMSHLIHDLLAYSRVERKGQKPQLTDARKSLDVALTNLQNRIKSAGATVTSDEMPTVLADSTQLMQIFQNLIGNAIKFRSPDRPCQIHVGAQKKGNQWVFWVRDNGIGIPPEQFARIFVIFQRLHTRDKYPGTGIGLAICKKIVDRHGGKIWVESKIGEGSTFYFAL